MRGATDYLKTELLNLLFHQGANPAVDPVHVALHDGLPGDSAANEISGSSWTDYGRQSVATTSGSSGWDAPAASGEAEFVDNSGQIDFGTATISGADPTLKGVSIWDAASGGNPLVADVLAVNRTQFVGLSADNTIYAPAHGFSNDQKVIFIGSSLPGGLSEGTEYYVISAATDNFQVATSQGGSAVSLTSDGMGDVGASRFKPVTDGDPVRFPAGDLDILLA